MPYNIVYLRHFYNVDGEFITKKEALEDEEWGGEIWEQDQSFD